MVGAFYNSGPVFSILQFWLWSVGYLAELIRYRVRRFSATNNSLRIGMWLWNPMNLNPRVFDYEGGIHFSAVLFPEKCNPQRFGCEADCAPDLSPAWTIDLNDLKSIVISNSEHFFTQAELLPVIFQIICIVKFLYRLKPGSTFRNISIRG